MFNFKTVLLIFLPIVCIEGHRFKIVAAEEFTVDPIIITRAKWGARERNGTAMALQSPVPRVIVHHTTKNRCTSQNRCTQEMKATQNYDVDSRGKIDISYNFYVGEDGNVYEGRGWNVVGDYAPLWDDMSIGICIIGNFRSLKPNAAAVNAVKNLISYGVSLKKISPAYSLYSQNQLSRSKYKNSELTKLVKSWRHGTSYWKKHEYYVS